MEVHSSERTASLVISHHPRVFYDRPAADGHGGVLRCGRSATAATCDHLSRQKRNGHSYHKQQYRYVGEVLEIAEALADLYIVGITPCPVR